MAGVIPTNYEILFEPLFHNFKFNGEEIITLNLSKLTNSIILDSAELNIKESHITQGRKIQKALLQVQNPLKSPAPKYCLNFRILLTIQLRKAAWLIPILTCPTLKNNSPRLSPSLPFETLKL